MYLKQETLTVVLLITMAINLRPSLTVVTPIFEQISDELLIGGYATGLVAAAPPLCMSIFAWIGAHVATWLGVKRSVAYVNLAIFSFTILRSLATGAPTFTIATFGLAAGIGALQSLLPTLVVMLLVPRPTQVVAVYSVLSTLSASFAASTSVHLLDSFGSWRSSLAIWALPALVCTVLARLLPEKDYPQTTIGTLDMRHREFSSTWLPVLFGAATYSAFWFMLGYLSLLLTRMGATQTSVGELVSLFMISQTFGGLLVIPLWKSDVRVLAGAAALVAGAGFLILGSGAELDVIARPGLLLSGIGIGAMFPISAILPVALAITSEDAHSKLAKTLIVGYLTAALFSLAVGPASESFCSVDDYLNLLGFFVLLFGFIALFTIRAKCTDTRG